MHRISFAILFLLFVSACTMPETKIYSLHLSDSQLSSSTTTGPVGQGGTPTAKSEKSACITIQSPRYLSQSYIAYRNSPYELEIARYAKWESSPGDMLREVFRNNLTATGIFQEIRLSNIVPEGFYVMELFLKKFERSDDGKESFADLVFEIVFSSPAGDRIYRGTFSRHIKLDDRTFLSLAKGLSKAVSESAAAETANISSVIRKQN